MKYLDISPDHSPNGMRFSNSPSSASVASRLYSNGQRSSRRTSLGSEPELINLSDSEVYTEFNDISTQVSSLSRRMNVMEESQMLSSEERSRLRTENAVLTERVHMLEEQQQSTEQQWREKLEEEKARNRELIGRMEREKELQLNNWQWKYEALERTSEMNKKERDRYYEEVTQLQANFSEMKDELTFSQSSYKSLEEEKKALQREFDRFREDAHNDLENSSELVEELTRQTNELRQKSFPIPRQGSLADQIVILEDEIERMRLESKALREQNDELQAQLLHDSVEKGRCLLADGLPSLAEELNGKDSTELMNALKEQEICNQKLRVYIDGILMRVIERHPEILQNEELSSNRGSSS
uniref:FIP-RBD domain-containing protein n=1 Tax=Steinernema glaseri TaxID=37863 RepID=A0A1I7Z3N9_9BILA